MKRQAHINRKRFQVVKRDIPLLVFKVIQRKKRKNELRSAAQKRFTKTERREQKKDGRKEGGVMSRVEDDDDNI